MSNWNRIQLELVGLDPVMKSRIRIYFNDFCPCNGTNEDLNCPHGDMKRARLGDALFGDFCDFGMIKLDLSTEELAAYLEELFERKIFYRNPPQQT